METWNYKRKCLRPVEKRHCIWAAKSFLGGWYISKGYELIRDLMLAGF